MKLRSRRPLAATLAALAVPALGAILLAGVAAADSPPVPDFFWPYGLIQTNGNDISPQVQTVMAFVNGESCGTAQTQVATAADGTPPGDVGHTVYVINVLANGTSAGDRAGCGQANAPVTLYLPQSHLIAQQQPLFQQGSERVDLNMSVQLSNQSVVPSLSNDGTP